MTGAIKKLVNDPVGYTADKLTHPISSVLNPIKDVVGTIKNQVLNPVIMNPLQGAAAPLVRAVTAPIVQQIQDSVTQSQTPTQGADAGVAAPVDLTAPIADVATGSAAARAAAKRRAAAAAYTRGGRQSTLLTAANPVPAAGLGGVGTTVLGG